MPIRQLPIQYTHPDGVDVNGGGGNSSSPQNDYVQHSDLANIAFTGNYYDLTNRPNIPDINTNIIANDSNAQYATINADINTYRGYNSTLKYILILVNILQYRRDTQPNGYVKQIGSTTKYQALFHNVNCGYISGDYVNIIPGVYQVEISGDFNPNSNNYLQVYIHKIFDISSGFVLNKFVDYTPNVIEVNHGASLTLLGSYIRKDVKNILRCYGNCDINLNNFGQYNKDHIGDTIIVCALSHWEDHIETLPNININRMYGQVSNYNLYLNITSVGITKFMFNGVEWLKID